MGPVLNYCLTLLVTTHAFTIKNSDKHDSEPDLFPDWVPFKNKHGDELGEFVPVQQKARIKKRLALPANFILRAVAAPEEDYFEKGLGENDSDDYFEKKEWSDLYRPANAVKHVAINHTDLSNIDGVVETITKKLDNPIVLAINKVKEEVPEAPEDTKTLEKFASDVLLAEDGTLERKVEAKRDQIDDDDDNVDQTTKKYSSEEEKENEARKAKILSSVDELKERHAEEQRMISAKDSEEDDYKFDKEKVATDSPYSRPVKKLKKNPPPDYDEYEDKNVPIEDKYKINPIVVRVTEDTETTQVTQAPSTSTTTTTQRSVVRESGKLSVFRNPQIYMIYDEETTRNPNNKSKFSSHYVTRSSGESDDERISLVPEESKEGEPTLFFPKKKNKRRKTKTTTKKVSPERITLAPHTNVRPLGTDHTTPYYDATAADSQVSTTSVPEYLLQDSTGIVIEDYMNMNNKPTTTDVNMDAGDNIPDIDVVPEASEQVKGAETKDYKKEKGGGEEHFSEKESEHEEHGKKAYKGHHEDKKTTKGHHNKEDHLGKYDDHGGVDKSHKEESKHYGDHHHEEHGKKHAKYEESGKHSKGHSTKGSHDIHKKEEYEKKVEFFEEDGDSGEDEKFGGFSKERKHGSGGYFKKKNLKSGNHRHDRGESEGYGKGGFAVASKAHNTSAGHDSHGRKEASKKHKEVKDSAKKWVYHHGYPAKTANLVVIDRRGDQLYHAPYYFG